jgi:hypothetical protein
MERISLSTNRPFPNNNRTLQIVTLYFYKILFNIFLHSLPKIFVVYMLNKQTFLTYITNVFNVIMSLGSDN